MTETVKTNNVLDQAQEAVNKRVEQNKPAELASEPQPFPVHTQGYITNTLDLTKLVSSLFCVFKDYEGCNIYSYIGQEDSSMDRNLRNTICNGSFYVDIFFRKNTNTSAVGLDNLVLAKDSSNGSVISRLRAMSGGTMQSVYTLNEDTKHILTKFLSGYVPNSNFNPMWSLRTFEFQDMQSASAYTLISNGNNYPTVLKVRYLSLDAILSEIYGRYESKEEEEADKNKTRPRYDYHAIPLTTSVAGISPMMYGAMNNMTPEERANSQQYVIQVLRNDRSIIEATQKAIGYTPITQVNGYVPFIRNN